MNFDIVTDSACNLPEGIIDEFNLHVLPLTFMVDGQQYQSYLKGVHTDLKQFYDMMREGKVITTSLPNMSESEKLLRSLLEAGRDVLYLGFSSGLSGTFEAIDLLIRTLAAAYPGRKIYAVDTLAASGGEGLLVWYAVQQARNGADIEGVRDWVEANKRKLAHWFTNRSFTSTTRVISYPWKRFADAGNRSTRCSSTWTNRRIALSKSKR